MTNVVIKPWTLRQHVRWWFAYLRLQAYRYFTAHHGALRLAAAAVVAVILLPVVTHFDVAPELVHIGGRSVQQHHAWVQIVVYLAILLVSAIVYAALAPPPPEPEVQDVQVPVADEGKAIIRVYGEAWIDDPMVLAFKTMGYDPIKAKGGKK